MLFANAVAIVLPLIVKEAVFVQAPPLTTILLTSEVVLKTSLPAVLDLPIFKILNNVQAVSPLPPFAPS